MSFLRREEKSRDPEFWIYFSLFAAGLLFNIWGTRVGWESRNLPGIEYRQAQTAISAYFIQQDHDFSFAYPTPVLGKPWSIPMEFPLYQWTVVGLSNLSGLELTKAGRVISQGCFYLCLPAVFLLLRRMRVASGRRWLVLAVVVTCPFYIFYSRAFLMETMALMFSLWFWVAFAEAVENRNWRWLAVAMLAGSGAGLVKVTTFMLYLLPSGWWALRRLGSSRSDGRWRGDLIWMAAAVALPFALTLWWLHFADTVKALNPCAQFIREGNVRDFTWGTWAMHLSPDLWQQKWRIITGQLSWTLLLLGGLALTILTGGRRGADMFRLLLWFGAALVIFPVLYALHEYYFIANGLLLLIALGLVLVGLAESGRPVWMVVGALLVFTGGQITRYYEGYYQAQKGISDGGDGLSHSLRGLTRPDEVLVITGQDWNSMTPYYARRRALMIKTSAENDPELLKAAQAALKGEPIGALVLGEKTQGREELIKWAEERGIDPQPLYSWHDATVYLPLARRSENILKILNARYAGVVWGKDVVLPVHNIAGEWIETRRLPDYQRFLFSTMQPEPVRFFSTYGPVLDGSTSVVRFGAHPDTKLVFKLPAGRHRLKSSLLLSLETYDENLASDQRTDGVEITLTQLSATEEPTVLFTRMLEPYATKEDRGWVPLTLEFTLTKPAEVELFFGPGPQGNATRDWICVGPLVIE